VLSKIDQQIPQELRLAMWYLPTVLWEAPQSTNTTTFLPAMDLQTLNDFFVSSLINWPFLLSFLSQPPLKPLLSIVYSYKHDLDHTFSLCVLLENFDIAQSCLINLADLTLYNKVRLSFVCVIILLLYTIQQA